MRLFALVVGALLFASGPALAGDPLEVTTSDGVRLHVELFGPSGGEPVLLLHGLAANARINFQAPGITGALADAGFRVVAVDQRGHGRSSVPGDAVYGRRMVADAVEVLDALSIERAHVVGYSMGGMVSLALAALHPERVRSVFLGGMGWLESGSRAQRFTERLFGGGDGRAETEDDDPPAPAPTAAPATGGGERRFAPPGCARQLADLALDEAAVRGIKAPIRIVVGEMDPTRVLVRRLVDVRPEVQVTLVSGVGHLRCVGSPELKAAIVAHCQSCTAH